MTKLFFSLVKDVVPYPYEELKEKGFEKIINSLSSGVSHSVNPVFVHMLGIPGAGKSTFYRKNAGKFGNHLFISFDAIMEAHPRYQEDVEKLGSVEAFHRWEIPARVAGYELLERAVNAGKNIFLDHSGAPECHQKLLMMVKEIGYRTEMFYIYCPIEVAVERARLRELKTGRHTPSGLIIERQKLIEKSISSYQSIVDKFVYV